MPEPRVVRALKAEFEQELFGSVIPFWERHSPDHTHGGYFNHLARDGRVYDPTKNVWLLARQVWMFSKLFTQVEPNPRWLALARSGVDFLRQHALTPTGQVYFALTAGGQPIYQQRKLFSECFYALALAEHARAAGEARLAQDARRMFATIWEMVEDPAQTGRPAFAGAPALLPLAVPMILLNLIDEMAGDAFGEYQPQVDYCLGRIRQHWVGGKLYEHVGPNGELRPDLAQGRLLNPGHAIEAGWFLLRWAERLHDPALARLAGGIIRQSFDLGWDKTHGGLLYFLDSEGFSPTQLEWDMKLWWPHCEALVACLILYALERDPADWERFMAVKDYAFAHFRDPEHGEWFGYLNRRGEVTHSFKGGPYKGCFHLPRALWLCLRLFDQLTN